MGVLATDDFTRADAANLGANWTNVVDGFKIVSNRAKPNSTVADACTRYSAISWPNDQYAQVTMQDMDVFGAESGMGVSLRVADSNNHYRIVVDRSASNNISIAKKQSSAYSLITTRTSAVAVNGDVFKAQIVGTTLKVFINGVQVGADITDATTTLLTGSAGLFESSNVSGSVGFSAFEGGDFAGADTGLAWIRA